MLESPTQTTFLYVILPIGLTFALMFGLILIGYNQEQLNNQMIDFCLSHDGQLVDLNSDGQFNCRIIVNHEGSGLTPNYQTILYNSDWRDYGVSDRRTD